ncbi:MAG: aminotransferase class I/II-fold pyridoxal phosphate-dependent enzyme [Rhizomicrobium sp.]
MTTIREEVKDDLLARGFSRRQMIRAAMMFGGAATALTMNPELVFAQQDRDPAMKVRIGSNECWTGPMAPGAKAAAAAISKSNRYSPDGEQANLAKTISQVESIPLDHILMWPGSNEALARAVVAFCSPAKGLVQANPTYETCARAAKFLEVPIDYVPLTATYAHDVKAMAAGGANAGLFYVVNPNNPTGTMTPAADIEWLVANKPQGAVVVIDEAYIHWSRGYPNNTMTHLARADKDVLVMRTFSKVFGMAGMRVGYCMGRPDLLAKLKRYDGGGTGEISVPSAACAGASMPDMATILSRRKTMWGNRAMTVDFLVKRGLKPIGTSEANMLMFDWKTRTAKEMQAAFRARGVLIAGPRWPIWPTVARISVGSKEDMEGFFAAFDKVVSA